MQCYTVKNTLFHTAFSAIWLVEEESIKHLNVIEVGVSMVKSALLAPTNVRSSLATVEEFAVALDVFFGVLLMLVVC